MKLATFRAGAKVSYGAVNGGDHVADLGAALGRKYPRLIDVIAAGALEECRAAMKTAERISLRQVQLLPPVPGADKIICVGVSYPDRNAEYKDGSEQPKNPSLFMRTHNSLVGHGEPIVRPPESIQFDYEGEIVMIIGKGGRRIPEANARDHVFGLTLMNEGSVRDWIRHGKFNVTQGKNFDRSGSIGPWIVTTDELPAFDSLTLSTEVNGEVRQRGATGEVMFSFGKLINYISTFTTLAPGDIISTGTPVGAGARFDPPRWAEAR